MESNTRERMLDILCILWWYSERVVISWIILCQKQFNSILSPDILQNITHIVSSLRINFLFKKLEQ